MRTLANVVISYLIMRREKNVGNVRKEKISATDQLVNDIALSLSYTKYTLPKLLLDSLCVSLPLKCTLFCYISV